MADATKIEWTDATWNPITGCSRVSEGCRNCYAEIMAARFSGPGQWGEGLAEVVGPPGARDHRWTGETRLAAHKLDQPLRWRRPRRIFVCSTADLFHEGIPDEWIDRVFAVMALAPQHVFQVLTKRPARMRAWRAESRITYVMAAAETLIKSLGWDSAPASSRAWEAWVDGFPNVWLGVSVENQAAADVRIPLLLATRAAKRFISAEPLLGPVDVWQWLSGAHQTEETGWIARRLDWIIAGGESGPGARPMHPGWPRALRDQCAAAGVPYFFKQWGEFVGEMERRHGWSLYHNGSFTGAWDHEWPDGARALEVGKKAAGAGIDERAHREFPS